MLMVYICTSFILQRKQTLKLDESFVCSLNVDVTSWASVCFYMFVTGLEHIFMFVL